MHTAVLYMPERHPVTPASSTFETSRACSSCMTRAASAMENRCRKQKPRGAPVNLSRTPRTSRTGTCADAIASSTSSLRKRGQGSGLLTPPVQHKVARLRTQTMTQTATSDGQRGTRAAQMIACSGNMTNLNVLIVYIRREGT